MKKDCAYTRKSLRKYLRGHLFKYEQVRIARHLNACPVCRSEFQALKKVADTKQLLRDITPAQGLARMKEGVSLLKKLRLLVYRPLWLLASIGFVVAIYLNVIAPGRHDLEIENLEKSVPVVAAAGTEPPAGPAPASVPAVATQPTASTNGREPARNPLLITISAQNEKESVQLIHDIMQGDEQLRKIKVSDSLRKISGELAAGELLLFVDRIEKAGKVSYSRKRFQSFPAAQPIPFLIKIKPAPKIAEQLDPASAVSKAAGAPALPASAPTPTAR